MQRLEYQQIMCPIHQIPMESREISLLSIDSGLMSGIIGDQRPVFKSAGTEKTGYKFECPCGCLFETVQIYDI